MTENMNTPFFDCKKMLKAHINENNVLDMEFPYLIHQAMVEASRLIEDTGTFDDVRNLTPDGKHPFIYLRFDHFWNTNENVVYKVDLKNDKYFINNELVKELPIITYCIQLENPFCEKKYITSISIMHGTFQVAVWDYFDYVYGKIGAINNYGKKYTFYSDNFLDVMENIFQFFYTSIEELKEEVKKIDKDWIKALRIKGD